MSKLHQCVSPHLNIQNILNLQSPFVNSLQNMIRINYGLIITIYIYNRYSYFSSYFF